MLVVTESAEIRAQQMLDRVAADAAGWRCLYLKPTAERELSLGQIRALTETFQHYMKNLAGGVFFSEHGHIWSIYKNELSPSQVFHLLEQLRKQYTDETHGIEHIFMDDLKLTMPQVMQRLEPLLARTNAPIKSNAAKTATATAPDRMASFLEDVPADAAKQIAGQRMRRREIVILAVEDDPFYSRLIERVFAAQARVIIAHQPDQVLEEYMISAPDVVLMDIGLPEISGHQLLKTILKIDPEAYIVMASGNSARDDVMGSINTGAKGFITKPFSRDKLIRAVNQSPTIKKHVS